MEIINSEMLSTPELERCITWGGCGPTCASFGWTLPPGSCGIDICWTQCICGINRIA